MTEIPATAFVRYRAIGERYRQETAAENDVRRRLGDARQTLRGLQAELARLSEPRYAHGLGGRLLSVNADAEAIAAIERRVRATEGEISLLHREAERAETRKSAAGDLLNRCSAHLLDLGAQRSQLDF